MKKLLLLFLITNSAILFAQVDTAKTYQFNFRAGINNSFFRIDKEPDLTNTNIQNQLSPKLGVEFEYIFKFDQRKWRLLSELSYQGYSYDGTLVFETTDDGNIIDKVRVDYNSINIGLGFKYSYAKYGAFTSYLAPKAVYAISTGKSIIDFTDLEDVNIESRLGYSLALGFVYNKRISFEFEYSSKVLAKNEDIKARLNTLAFLVAYSI